MELTNLSEAYQYLRVLKLLNRLTLSIIQAICGRANGLRNDPNVDSLKCACAGDTGLVLDWLT